MPVTAQSTQVTAETFNDLVTQAVNFLGIELGQLCRPRTKFVGSDQIVTNEDWNDLINDIIDARTFTLLGSSARAEVSNSLSSPWTTSGIPSNNTISASLYNDLEQMIEDAQTAANPGYTNLGTENFSFTVPDDTNVGFTGSVQIGFPGGYTYTSNAKGETRVASNVDHARHWTNAGGRVISDIEASNVPEDDKNQDYVSMADLISASPPNWSPLEGDSEWRSLAGEASAYNTYATATYGSNSLELLARKVNDYTGEIEMRLTDGSTGAPDEIVTADFTTNNRVYYPSTLGNNLKPTAGTPTIVTSGITDYYVDIELPKTGSQSGSSRLFNDPVNTDTNAVGEYNVPLGTYNVRVTGSVTVDGTRDGIFGIDKDPAGDVYLIIRTLSNTGPDLEKFYIIPGKSTSARTVVVDETFQATGFAVHYALLQWSYNGDGPHWIKAKLRFQLDPV